MPNTTPADDGAAKTSTSGKRAAAADTAAKNDSPAAEAVTEPAPADSSGWFRNTGPSPVNAMFDGHPSVRVEPGESKYLPEDPHFPHLEPCDAPDTAAADTTRSEQ